MSTSEVVKASPRWHGEEVSSVVEAFGTDTEAGLKNAEAKTRLEEYGPNRLSRRREVTLLGTLWEEIFEEPLVLFLVAVGVLYAVWGSLTDALAIFAIIVLLALAEGFNEFRAKRAVAALQDLSAPTARVIRDGHVKDVAAEALVPGDLVLLAAGDRIPADLRLVEATALSVDESALTGEAVPVEKDARARVSQDAPVGDRTPMAHAGTVVTRGRGRGIVVATGMGTEVGGIAGLVEEAKQPKTPLERTMRDLARKLTFVAIGVSLLVPVLGVALGQPFREMVLTGLTLAFATVPEELPILITMVLAFGAYRLSRRGAIVKRLRAAETLGSVDLLLTDKTGTLTENRMRVAGLTCLDEVTEQQLLRLAATATDTTATPDGLAGDAIDVALLERMRNDELEPLQVEKLFPFDEDARAMAAVSRGTLVVKGAPEAILAHTAARPGGDLEAARGWADEQAARGERVIAVGARRVDTAEVTDPLADELSLVGLIAFADPPREEAPGAISALIRAGVQPVMVTGDHPATARAIARSVGIPAERVMTGRDLDGLDDREMEGVLEDTSIFARMSPGEKLRLVEAAQRAGRTVAVTGDGVNDAPALRAASAGVAMGEGGTDVAREAADIVLTEDNVSTIARMLREGRMLFDNLSGAVRYYLAAKVALILTVFLPVLFGYPVPLTPIQIIVMEFFMDLGASATFVTERAAGNLMDRPPRDPRRPFLDRPMILTIFGGGAILGAGVLAAFFWATGQGPIEHARTVAFATWLAAHIALAISFRRRQNWNGALALWAVGAISLAALAGLFGPVQRWLHTAPLTLTDAGVIAGTAIAVLVLGLLAQRFVGPLAGHSKADPTHRRER